MTDTWRIRPRIYISHPIRGDGRGTISENIRRALSVVTGLRLLADDRVDFYCPAEHDEPLQIAWRKGMLSVEQLLEIDYEIIKRCQALIFCNWERSEGVEKEKEFAEAQGIKTFHFPTQIKEALDYVCNETKTPG